MKEAPSRQAFRKLASWIKVLKIERGEQMDTSSEKHMELLAILSIIAGYEYRDRPPELKAKAYDYRDQIRYIIDSDEIDPVVLFDIFMSEESEEE